MPSSVPYFVSYFFKICHSLSLKFPTYQRDMLSTYHCYIHRMGNETLVKGLAHIEYVSHPRLKIVSQTWALQTRGCLLNLSQLRECVSNFDQVTYRLSLKV